MLPDVHDHPITKMPHYGRSGELGMAGWNKAVAWDGAKALATFGGQFRPVRNTKLLYGGVG